MVFSGATGQKKGTCVKQEPIIYAYSYAVMGDGNNHVREQRPD